VDPAREVSIRSVAYYAHTFRPAAEPTGLTSYVDVLRQGLRARGVRARVLTHAAEEGDPDAVPLPRPWLLRRSANLLERLREGAGAALWEQGVLALGARALAAREQIAAVEIEEHAGIGRLLARARLPCPWILRLHGPHFLVAGSNGDPWDRRSRRFDRDERLLAARARAVSAPSRDVLRRAREHWRLPLPGAVVIPNPARLVPEEERWTGAPGGPILFVGRFDRTKGADLVVRAFRRLAPRFPRTELWLVGPERPLRQEGRVYGAEDFLAAELPDPAVRSRVRFLGLRTPAEVAAYRRGCACAVVASRFETFCLAAVEAMMAGSPLVASDAGALPEIVEDGATGLLFRSGDAGDLARALERVLAGPDLARRLGEAGRRAARERYAPEVVAGRMIELYAEAARARRERRPVAAAALGGETA
jgi:glycosyltransferase involved in cell wall biosynthesis